jgi:hypothetical protein
MEALRGGRVAESDRGRITDPLPLYRASELQAREVLEQVQGACYLIWVYPRFPISIPDYCKFTTQAVRISSTEFW